MRNWPAAGALQPYPTTTGAFALLTIWARGMANGRLHRVKEVADDLKSYDAAVADLQKSPYADMLPRFQLYRTEVVAWQQFAQDQRDAAVATMRKAADEQDRLGQGEVDLPAREMLGDMLLDLKRPKEALVEYKVALMLSPNRLNGLYGAGRAAEALGMKKEAGEYYATMLKNTDDGAHSKRLSLAHAKEFVGAKTVAGN
jgi:tetratricopeptide (TPR) repeat protein